MVVGISRCALWFEFLEDVFCVLVEFFLGGGKGFPPPHCLLFDWG